MSGQTKRVVCVNLGCGSSLKNTDELHEWINLDKFDNPGVDVVQNLEEGLPCFEDESIDLLYASHVFEHIRNWTQLMKECHRVLKPRGCLSILVPERRCRAAVADPTHVNMFTAETWFHFSKDANIGFDTLGMRDIGLILKWVQELAHYRNNVDDGVPGNYFTELVVDYEKEGELYPWEEVIQKLTNPEEIADA